MLIQVITKPIPAITHIINSSDLELSNEELEDIEWLKEYLSNYIIWTDIDDVILNYNPTNNE